MASIVLSKSPAYWAPGFFVLRDDGVERQIDFELRFKRLRSSQHKEVLAKIEKTRTQERLRALEPSSDKAKEAPAITDGELLDLVLIDWRGFFDADGQPVPYSPEVRAQLVEDWYGMEAAMARAWLDTAYPEQRRLAAEKN